MDNTDPRGELKSNEVYEEFSIFPNFAKLLNSEFFIKIAKLNFHLSPRGGTIVKYNDNA